MQNADPLSRTTPNTVIEPVKKVNIDLNKCISHNSYSTPCEVCPGCNVFCQRKGNHSDGKFNIRNKGEEHPQIIDYKPSAPETVRVEGK